MSGEVEGFSDSTRSGQWLRIAPGDIFHVPSGVRYAFRNRSDAPAVAIILSTARLGRFFQDIGVLAELAGPPSEHRIRRFLATAARYGYWNASPQENAQIGLRSTEVGG
jgi:hypothetical protein